MLAQTTLKGVAIACRLLSVLICASMLLSVIALRDVAASTRPALIEQGERAIVSGSFSGGPIRPDALPCHAAHHLCDKVTPLPPAIVAGNPAVLWPEFKLLWASTRVLLSSVTEMPPKPPRA
ncbi:Hypothetical protein RMP42_05812 (plasmid) [Roseomonas mucosa]|nr:Hypothetical protein RMP42_05812 [Roseomonas mucosa]